MQINWLEGDRLTLTYFLTAYPYGGAVVGGIVENSIGGSDGCGCSY